FTKLLRRFAPKLRLEQDVSSLSLLACLICYLYLARVSDERAQKRKGAKVREHLRLLRGRNGGRIPPPPVYDCLPEVLPDIVVIQSESFFDPRHLHPDIDRNILPNYTRLAETARYRGRLRVPAWGANTLRT